MTILERLFWQLGCKLVAIALMGGEHCTEVKTKVNFFVCLTGILWRFSTSKNTGKNNGFPFLDILGYLNNTHKNPKFGKERRVPTRQFPTKFPGWDLSHSSKFGIFMGILLNTLKYPKMGNIICYFFL